MKYIIYLLRIICITAFTSSFSAHVLAGPVVDICINEACKKKASVKISNDTWKNVADIFSAPYPTDKDEQDNAITAYTLLRADIYQTLAQNNSLGDDAISLYESNNSETHYKNAKTLIVTLLDNQFIKRHYLRKTIKRSTWSKAFSWSGIKHMDSVESDGLLLQSITDAQQYVFKIDNDFAEPTIITPYNK